MANISRRFEGHLSHRELVDKIKSDLQRKLVNYFVEDYYSEHSRSFQSYLSRTYENHSKIFSKEIYGTKFTLKGIEINLLHYFFFKNGEPFYYQPVFIRKPIPNISKVEPFEFSLLSPFLRYHYVDDIIRLIGFTYQFLLNEVNHPEDAFDYFGNTYIEYREIFNFHRTLFKKICERKKINLNNSLKDLHHKLEKLIDVTYPDEFIIFEKYDIDSMGKEFYTLISESCNTKNTEIYRQDEMKEMINCYKETMDYIKFIK